MLPAAGFEHEARFYAGPEGFLASTVPFVRNGLDRDAAVLVVVAAHKIAWLCDALGTDADGVRFADMAEVGRNPARILPLWRQFVDEEGAGGRALAGIGEPVGPDRDGAAIVECHRHERLLNMAFLSGRPWQLLCPYDIDALDPTVVEEARCTHPYVDGGPNLQYASSSSPTPFDVELPPAPDGAAESTFDHRNIRSVRRSVTEAGRAAGVDRACLTDLALASHEVATNSLRYGGGYGRLRTWVDGDAFVVEIRDAGFLDDPFVGRAAPPVDQRGGRGVWLCNQLCDLVQIHSTPATGTTVRLRAQRPS